jgi:hypothetical protein
METTIKDKKTKELEAKWLKRCEEWDWNSSIADIARELKDEGIEYRTQEFVIIERVFNKYFGGKGGIGGVNSKGIPVIPTMEAIGEILEQI